MILFDQDERDMNSVNQTLRMLDPSWSLSRRDWLCRIGGGFGALGLTSVLADTGATRSLAQATPGSEASVPTDPLAPKAPHFPARAKRVIFLFMNGGPSHVDTFDPKPMLRTYEGQRPQAIASDTRRPNRGGLMPSPFSARPHGQSGIEVSELFPHLAGCIDDLCVIRSLHTDNPNHEPSLLMMNSGNMQPIRPSLGSWLTYGLGTENQNLPGFVVLCPGKPVVGPQLWSNSFLPGIYQGTHINNGITDPDRIIRDITSKHLSTPAQREQLDLLQSLNRTHLETRHQDEALETRIASLEQAYRMQFEAREAFDLGRESAATHALYGEGKFAGACLIARRLVERGVRVVQVYYGSDQPWDDHQDISRHREHARQSDRPVAALIKDLKVTGHARRDVDHLGRGVRPHPDLGGGPRARSSQSGIHDVAGRRRCQRRICSRGNRRIRLSRGRQADARA